jgi:hypothetical protein
METCKQTKNQNVYEHGLSVWKYTEKILNKEWDGLNLPDWFKCNFSIITDNICDIETIKTYNVYHDCGKPFCIEIDDEGKQHFPNHANVSYDVWKTVSDDETVAELISLDMVLHVETAEQIVSRNIKLKILLTLLITAFAELHSNAEMFGGIDSLSFKIKHKKICQRGKMIMRRYVL